MAKKSLDDVKKEFKEFGFDAAVVEIAYANVDGNTDRIMDEIFRLQSESSAYPTVYLNPVRNLLTPVTSKPNWAKLSRSRWNKQRRIITRSSH